MSSKIVLVVSVALWSWEKRAVLLAQRPQGKDMAGLWEFPGGKIENHETPEEALIRELYEELSIRVKAQDLSPLNFVSYSYSKFHLLMPLYFCCQWTDKVQCLEHQNHVWVPLSELDRYPMPPADQPLPDLLNRYIDNIDQ